MSLQLILFNYLSSNIYIFTACRPVPTFPSLSPKNRSESPCFIGITCSIFSPSHVDLAPQGYSISYCYQLPTPWAEILPSTATLTACLPYYLHRVRTITRHPPIDSTAHAIVSMCSAASPWAPVWCIRSTSEFILPCIYNISPGIDPSALTALTNACSLMTTQCCLCIIYNPHAAHVPVTAPPFRCHSPLPSPTLPTPMLIYPSWPTAIIKLWYPR